MAENNHLIYKFDSAGSHDIVEDACPACPSGNLCPWGNECHLAGVCSLVWPLPCIGASVQ